MTVHDGIYGLTCRSTLVSGGQKPTFPEVCPIDRLMERKGECSMASFIGT